MASSPFRLRAVFAAALVVAMAASSQLVAAVDLEEELTFVKLAQLDKGAHLDDCSRLERENE